MLVTNNTCVCGGGQNSNFFMVKWDIKDGFWCLDCTEGEEYNFAYVLPQPEEEPIQIVIPTSLQMGWVKSPPYFCAATETARGIAKEYIKVPATTLRKHNFVKYTIGDKEYEALPTSAMNTMGFLYMVEVCVCVCVCACPPVMGGDTDKHVLTSTSSPPQ